MPKPKKKRRHSVVIQEHHIRYASLDGKVPEWKVKLWKGEHFCMTLMNRRRRISKGFITALKDFIERMERYAEELS